MEPLSTERLVAALSGLEVGPFGKNLHYLPQTGSTNDLARQLAQEHAPEGTVVIADRQTAGRGRAGRSWSAPANTSLLMTILFRPAIPAVQINRLVMGVGLAIADAVESLIPCRVDVKWPNDLQIGGKKFTGILPESSLIGNMLEWVLVGAGINVNQRFDPGDPLAETATSLYVIAGETLDRATIFAQIMQHIHHRYSQIGDNNLSEAWRERCITLNQRIRVTIPGKTVIGLAEDIDVNGALLLRDDRSQLHRLTIGEAHTLRSAD